MLLNPSGAGCLRNVAFYNQVSYASIVVGRFFVSENARQCNHLDLFIFLVGGGEILEQGIVVCNHRSANGI